MDAALHPLIPKPTPKPIAAAAHVSLEADSAPEGEFSQAPGAVHPAYLRHVAAQRRSQGLAAAPRPQRAGELAHPVQLGVGAAHELLQVAAREASGLFRPGGGDRHAEVLWEQGDNQLAVVIAKLSLAFEEGALTLRIPVRCDQVGTAMVEVLFATGRRDAPAGLYAATPRRPSGPEPVVATWGDALQAFAWETLLNLLAGLAAASGKDTAGSRLVPVDLTVGRDGLELQPMARHRFFGGSGLKGAPSKPPRAPAP